MVSFKIETVTVIRDNVRIEIYPIPLSKDSRPCDSQNPSIYTSRVFKSNDPGIARRCNAGPEDA